MCILSVLPSLALAISPLPSAHGGLLRRPSLPRAPAVASSNPSPSAQPLDALIVGGGPGGLAAAIGLAKSGMSVTVVEKREAASSFETKRAYLYLIDKRGQLFTDAFQLTSDIRDRGVLNEGYTITRAWPDKRGLVVAKPMLALEATAKSIWIPRAALLEVSARRSAAL